MIDGCALIASAALKALSKVNTDLGIASSAVTSNIIDLEFEDGKHFFDTLAGGVGATLENDGSHGFSFWQRSRLQPSIEDLELRFPLRVNFIETRKISGGKGVHMGGDGLNKSISILAPGTLKWSLEQNKRGPEGINGGASGTPTEMLFQSGDNKKENLKSTGEKPVKDGDTIVLKSAGGGGHTKAPLPDF